MYPIWENQNPHQRGFLWLPKLVFPLVILTASVDGCELREALKKRDQLWVAFQPLYNGRSGEIAGAEALARWTHPRLGQISPARFIPIAEGAGLIETLGEFVLRQACMFGARWPGRRMAVNISPAQLRNPRFPERVDLLVETAMRPSDLELEITESILLENERQALEALTTFRKAGIRIAPRSAPATLHSTISSAIPSTPSRSTGRSSPRSPPRVHPPPSSRWPAYCTRAQHRRHRRRCRNP